MSLCTILLAIILGNSFAYDCSKVIALHIFHSTTLTYPKRWVYLITHSLKKHLFRLPTRCGIALNSLILVLVEYPGFGGKKNSWHVWENCISLFKARPKPHSKQMALLVILRGFCSRLLVYGGLPSLSMHLKWIWNHHCCSPSCWPRTSSVTKYRVDT